jgi:hypothetical protein
MSRNIIFVLMYHRHKLLDLIYNILVINQPLLHASRLSFFYPSFLSLSWQTDYKTLIKICRI